MAFKHVSQSLFFRTSTLGDGVMPKFTICNSFSVWLNFVHSRSRMVVYFELSDRCFLFSTYTLPWRRPIIYNSISKSVTVSQLRQLSQHIATGHKASKELKSHDFVIANKFWPNLNHFKYSFLQIIRSIGVIKRIKFAIVSFATACC